MDFEKVLESCFSGYNTRAGDILNVRFTHLGNTAANYAHNMHFLLHSDMIMEVRDSGVAVYDEAYSIKNK